MPRWGEPDSDALADGRRALDHHVQRLGGRAAWESLPTLACDVAVSWSAAARMWRPPMPSSVGTLYVHFGLDKARLDFAHESSVSWAHDSVSAWTSANGARTYEHVHHAARVVPTLKWYAAMPYKLLDSGVQHRVPEGQPDQVLVQFGTTGGQTGDRMLATFADDQLVELQHTARGLGEQVVAAARFGPGTPFAGMWLPSEVRVTLRAPAPIRDAEVIRFSRWRTASVGAGFFEIPAG